MSIVYKRRGSERADKREVGKWGSGEVALREPASLPT